MDPRQILTFWFEELRSEQWFKKDPDLDLLIKSRFLEVVLQAKQGKLNHWRDTAEGSLAEILVLDQFTRNIFRDDARAFDADSLAQACCLAAVEKGFPSQLTQQQRWFLYMPLMHSEDLAHHDRALTLFNEPGLESAYKYEVLHKEVIEKFGRYPHRNKILERDSTPEELDYLETNGGF